MFYEEGASVVDDFTRAFRSLKPVADSTTRKIAFPSIYKWTGVNLGSPACQKNQNMASFPSSYAQWDVAAMRAGFNLFSEATAGPTVARSQMVLETYGNEGVRAVPDSENAVAPEERRYDILTSVLLVWTGNDQAKTAKAVQHGQSIQAAARSRRSPPHSYVNYAIGSEGLEEVYGRDEARLARLRRLKGAYDGHNRFGFYMPLRPAEVSKGMVGRSEADMRQRWHGPEGSERDDVSTLAHRTVLSRSEALDEERRNKAAVSEKWI